VFLGKGWTEPNSSERENAMKLPICLLMFALPVFLVRANEPPELRIAVVVPLSSSIGEIAQEAVNGAALGMKEGALRLKSSQQQGGKDAFNAKLDVLDDRADPSTAVELAKNIVAKHQHHAVVGGINSGTAIPVAKIFEEAELINVALGATNPKLTLAGHQWVFRMSMNDHLLPLSTYLAVSHRVRDTPAVFVHDGTAYGELTAQGFASAHRALTDKHVELHNLGLNGDTALAAAREIKGSEAVIFVGGLDLFATNVARRLRKDVNWTIVGGDGICSPHMAKEAARLNMRLICASQERNPTVPLTNTLFESAYKAQYGRSPRSTAAFAAFEAVALLVEAFGLNGQAGSARVRDHMRSGVRFSGVEGPIAFDEKGDNTFAPAYLYEERNGVLKFESVIR
jgi:branched-chain amino acid transport system substrate-binding protein